MGKLYSTLTSRGDCHMTYLLLLLDHPLQLCVLLLDHCVSLLQLCVLLLQLCVLLLDHPLQLCVLLLNNLLLPADGDVVFISGFQGSLQDRLIGIAACTAQIHAEAINTDNTGIARFMHKDVSFQSNWLIKD